MGKEIYMNGIKVKKENSDFNFSEFKEIDIDKIPEDFVFIETDGIYKQEDRYFIQVPNKRFDKFFK